jgi:hypothetical protein
MTMRVQHALLLLVLVLGATVKLSVDANQITTPLEVRAKVVDSCTVSVPGRVESATEALGSVRVRCDQPAVWKIIVDSGAISNATRSDALRVTINF